MANVIRAQWPEPAVLRVAVLIGDEVLRWGVEAMVRALPGVRLAHRFDSPAELADVRSADRFDVLLVSAFDAPAVAAPRRPADGGPRILVIIGDPGDGDPRRYARFAADGYVARADLSPDLLGDAIARCAEGGVPMPPALARALLDAARPEPTPGRLRSPRLTDRETQALRLMAEGLGNAQIGRRLGISGDGAKRLVSSIMIKLDAPNRTTAVVTALRAGLVDGPPRPTEYQTTKA